MEDERPKMIAYSIYKQLRTDLSQVGWSMERYDSVV